MDEARLTEIERTHIYGRDCWCNPLVVTEGSSLLMPRDGTIVQMDPIAFNQAALHFEPHNLTKSLQTP